ncbi:MAG: hypothetical protein IKV85_04495 [Ruminococcus sp.]|nr:hypothetical protein [Ruminococcus sp.]
MNKKEKNFSVVVGIIISMTLGAGGMYLANFKKISFMDRYPQLLEVEKFVTETLEIDVPKPEDDKHIVSAYLTLYGDKYTRVEEHVNSNSKEYAVDYVNNSSVAKNGGFRVQFNEKDQPYFSVVTEGKTAFEQGIRVGDVIKNIDDFELTEYKHIIRIVGEDGEHAKIIVERDKKDIVLDYVRSSEEPEVYGISSKMYGNALYVDVDNIAAEMSGKFQNELADKTFKSIIIDLRDNGGGQTTSSVEIADLFVGKSQTIMHAKNGQKQVFETNDEITYDVPIVVLINENTASAAEILTAILKQYGDGKLVGMNTFGKGIYQNFALYKGCNIRYTDGYYTVGEWDCYQGEGIKPDIEVDMHNELMGTEFDIQLEKALELVK